MQTFTAKPAEVKHDWFVLDATDQVLGRLASEVAHRLRGKHKPVFTPHTDTGDYVIVINAEKIKVTGRKLQDKLYYRHSGYTGSIKNEALGKMLKRVPARVIEIAVKGMLPRGPLGRQMFRKLKVYAGGAHQHSAQQPQSMKL